jgi:hypothetical protein
MDNAACQSCHQRRFESFAADHSDFGIWPYDRRSRIAFNHASHRDKHFIEKKQAFDCRSCHVEDATGKVQQLASYETACAKCHDEKIATSVAQGVPMFVLPTLDVSATRAAGLDMGAWPDAATGDFDGRLPPAMKLLLAADPVAAGVIRQLGADFDFQDVDPADRRQLEACAAIASAIKELLAELSASPGKTVRERLSRSLGHPVSEAEVGALLAGLSVDTLRNAAAVWAGGITTSHRNVPLQPADNAAAQAIAPSPPPSPGGRRSVERLIAFAPTGTWTYDDESLAIRYQPAGHADPVLTTWLELVGKSPHLGNDPIAAAMFKELSKPNALGLCTSCHSAEKLGAESVVINWRAHDRTTEARGFTKFSHGPHLLLPQLADCTHCHAVDATTATATTYTDLNPAQFVSDFAPITKQQCTTCHTAKAAGDTCQKCHNYHVDAAQLRLMKAAQLKNLWEASLTPMDCENGTRNRPQRGLPQYQSLSSPG